MAQGTGWEVSVPWLRRAGRLLQPTPQHSPTPRPAALLLGPSPLLSKRFTKLPVSQGCSGCFKPESFSLSRLGSLQQKKGAGAPVGTGAGLGVFSAPLQPCSGLEAAWHPWGFVGPPVSQLPSLGKGSTGSGEAEMSDRAQHGVSAQRGLCAYQQR